MDMNDSSNKPCRICGGKQAELMDFGVQPNTFALLTEPDSNVYLHPLRLQYCTECGFVSNADPIPADKLYTNYNWATSTYPARHYQWMQETILDKYLSDKNGLVLDVGCNDGYFLSLLSSAGATNLLGIEPTADCAGIARERGLTVLQDYFNQKTSSEIVKEYGFPAVVICRHVIEHIEDLDDFMGSFVSVMSEKTTLVLEFPSFETIVGKGDFSSIWEQHINFFSQRSIADLLKKHGLAIIEENLFSFGGGSQLLFAMKTEKHADAAGTDPFILIEKFKANITGNIQRTKEYIKKLHEEGKKIAAFGAGARGSCLINISNIAEYIDCIVDDNNQKHGLYLPKSNLPVLPAQALYDRNIDYCILLPMNAKENEALIMDKHSDFVSRGGKFIEIFPEDFRDSRIF